jgi:hypothetical protein
MNAIIVAAQTAKAHIENLVGNDTAREDREKELKKMNKDELIAIIMAGEKFEDVKVEEVVKPILEDPACAWLDYETIATMVREALGSKTTHKSIASYASKNPKNKGWEVVQRKSQADKTAEMMKLINS